MPKITVITADVIGSRETEIDPEDLSAQLTTLTHPALLVPFTLSRGDEMQGVVDGWLSAPEIIRHLRWRCSPLQLRIGIGLGLFRGKLEKDPWKMSASPFFRARKALDESGRKKEPSTRIVTGSEVLDEIINSTLVLLDVIQSGWTPGQWEAVMTYEAAGTYAAAALQLGVAAQNVQKRCKAASWNHFRRAELGLKRWEELVDMMHPDLGDNSKITLEKVRGVEQ